MFVSGAKEFQQSFVLKNKQGWSIRV
jgi:hypothetical protein